jgi:hypothetical protein
VLSYPSGMTVSNRALIMLADLCAPIAPSCAPDGGAWTPDNKPCWWSPTCAKARPTPIWLRIPDRYQHGLPLPARSPRAAGCDGTHPDRSDRGRGREGLGHPRRHPAAHRPGRHDRGPGPALLLSRHGARCRCCHRSVSPCRSPNPACDSHRTGLSTVSAIKAWLRLQGRGIVLPR